MKYHLKPHETLDEEKLKFNIDLSKGWKYQTISPISNAVTRPSIMPHITSEFIAENGLYLPNKYLTITNENEIGEMISIIESKQRNSPVVFLSRNTTLKSKNLGADPKKVASSLAGIAMTAITKSNELDELLNDKLRQSFGSEFMCYDGAIRVYWPRKEHDMFDKIYFKDQINNEKFAYEILNFISNVSTTIPLNTTFNALKSEIELNNAKKGDADVHELLSLYMKESEVLRLENEQLKQQEEDLKEKEFKKSHKL